MENVPAIRALTREEIGEAFELLNSIEEAIGSIPYRDGKHAAAHIGSLRELVEDVFPGGFVGRCEACAKPIGGDEVAASDYENGGHFCASCAPSPTELADHHEELRSVDPGNANLPENSGAPAVDPDGWTDWPGDALGTMPVEVGASIDIMRRDGHVRENVVAGETSGIAARTYWVHLNQASDIVRYRVRKPADRSDGGLNIILKHSEIDGGGR